MSQARTGVVPPLAPGYVARPDLDAALAEALIPGATVVLVPAGGTTQAGTTSAAGIGAAGGTGSSAGTGSSGGTGASGGTAPAGGTGSAGTGRTWRDACGKTQAAVAHTESLWASDAIEILVWVTAASRAAVLSAYAEAATAARAARPGAASSQPSQAHEMAEGFLAWLSGTARPWLVVLDDLADPAVMDGLWPSGPAGRTLITTPGRAVLEKGILEREAPAGHAVIPVGTFTPHQSLGYLTGRLTVDLDQRQGAVDLAVQLGNEPLALAQASAVIASSELTCRGYLDILAGRHAQTGATSPAMAALTWAIAVEHAAQLSPGLAHPQLMFTALLDGNGIPGAVYARASRHFGLPGGAGADGLAALEAAGLLAADPATGLVRMNWAVQAAIRAASPPDALAGTAVAAADALLATWPADEAGAAGRAFRACADRLHQVAGEALWSSGCHPLLPRAGESLEAAGLTGPAAAYWDGLAAMSDKMLGGGHSDTLAIRARLGLARLAAGQAAEAAEQFRLVTGERARSLGPDHPSTARACLDLGRALLAADRVADAIAALEDATARYDRATGPDSTESIAALEDLAAARARAGQADAAIALYRRTLAVRQRAQGATHPDSLATCHRLADACLAAGQAKSAISLYKRVLEEREKSLGREDPLTIAARGSLAAAYFATGRMSQALQLLEQVRSEYTRAIGAGHRTTLATSLNLANAYHSVGRLTDAARLLQATVELCEQNLTGSDTLTIAAREGLAAMTGAG